MVNSMVKGACRWVATALWLSHASLGAAWASAPAPTPLESPARPLHEGAMRAFHDGDFAQALALEQRAHALEPSPVYLYQIGRALEGLGMLSDAYQSYLLARANLDGHPHTDDTLRELVTHAIEALGSLHDKAVLRLTGVTPEVTVQVDARMVIDPTTDVVLEPGPHRVCLFDGARRAVCLQRDLPPGQRIVLPLANDLERFARLELDPAPRFARVEIDGQLLLVEPHALDVIHLPPGRHRSVLVREGGSRDTIEHDLLAGQSRRIDPLPQVVGTEAIPRARASLAPWVTIGAGAALVVVSATLFGVAASEREGVRDAAQNELGQVTGISQRDAYDRWHEAERLDTWGFGLGATGLGAVIAGTVWALVEAP